jgi:hypothetical protein
MEAQMEPEQSTGKALPLFVHMKLGEALRSYFDVSPTLPERLYELVTRLECNISRLGNTPKDHRHRDCTAILPYEAITDPRPRLDT